MHADLSAHEILLRHAIARFVELRIDGLVRSTASSGRALTWALRHLVEEIRTGPHPDRSRLPVAVWSDDEDDDTHRRHRHTRRTVMIAQEHHARAGQSPRHGRTTHGRLPPWQRQRPQVHGARTAPHGDGVVLGQGVRHGRRGVR